MFFGHQPYRLRPVAVGSYRNMMTIIRTHPRVAEEFQNGNFVVRKSYHSFSCIPTHQAYEQNNKCVMGDGGAIGLTQNSYQLYWMVSGSDIARMNLQHLTS